MGIFGRDERTSQSQPATPQPAGRQPSGNSQTAAAATIIARSNRLEGTVLGAGDVRVEGEIKGSVDTTGQLLVAESGSVDGTIKARGVIVAGAVTGDIAGTERIELRPSSKVAGNITAPRILINDGATFDGQVVMKEPGGKPSTAATQPAITTSSARRNEPAKDADAAKTGGDAPPPKT